MSKRVGLFVNGKDPNEDLKAGINDVSKIYSILTDEKLGQCDRTLSEMKNDIFTKNHFNKILDDFLKKLNLNMDNNQFIFYFSGHGEYKNGIYHLRFGEDLYSFNTFRSELESHGITKAIIIIDACFSGAAVEGMKGSEEICFRNLPDGIAILSSSSENEFSFEKDDKTFSVFTHLLCQCIETGNNGNPTTNNEINVTDIIEYVKTNNTHHIEQQPKYKIENADNSIWIAKNITLATEEKTSNTLDTPKLSEIEKIDYENSFFTEKINHQIKIEELDWKLIKLYINKKNIDIDITLDKKDIVDKLLFTKHEGILNAVVLNFALRPEKFIPQAYIMITIDKSSRKEFYGNSKTLLDKTVEYILSKIDEYSYYIKTGRIDDYVVPQKLLREAISNALTHRCYDGCEDPIKINIAKTKKQIEIKSPGNFLGDCQKMLSDDDNDFSSLRDARMGDYIMNLGVAEGLGRGFDHYRGHIKEYGNDFIVFNNDKNFTKVILKFQQGNENNHVDIFDYPKVLTPLLGYSSIQPIGLDVELDYIKHYFENNSILSISGIVGVGKTELATAYLNSKKDEFNYLGFIDCRDGIRDSFISSFQISLNLKEKDYEKMFNEILVKLQNLKGTKLLILDDISKIETQKESLQAISNLVSCGYKIIITSTEKNSDYQTLELNTMPNDQSIELFKSIYKYANNAELEELLNFVGNHPLAIKLIANALASNKSLRLKQLLEKFKRGELSQIRISRHETLLKLLNDSFDLSSLNNEEMLILQQFSILPSLEISYTQLEKIFSRINDEEFAFILEDLVQKGWLNYKNKSYQMHPLIQSFIQEKIPPNFDDTQKIYNFFTKVLKDTDDILKIIKNFAYLPYIDTLVNYAIKTLINKFDNKNIQLADFYENAAKLYKEHGNYLKALLLYKNVLKIKEENTKQEDLVPIYNKLSEIYQMMGQLNDAQILNEKVLLIQKNISDEYHPELISSLNNHASILMATGNLQEAESIYLKVLSLLITASDLHPFSSTSLQGATYNNLAYVYELMGDYEKALSISEQALKINNILGSSNPQTATTYSNLVQIYQSMGDNEKALSISEQALESNENIFGRSHPQTARIYNNLAHVYQSMGDYEKALPYYEKALEINEGIFSNNHSEVINLQKSLIEVNKNLNTNESISNIEKEIKNWFFDNYDDPVNLLPYESKEGGYIYIWGGPYELKDVINNRFYNDVDKEIIDKVIKDIESEYGDIEWSKQPEQYLSLNITLDFETSERAGAGGTFQVVSVEESEFFYDMTELIDVGTHYHEISEVIEDISKQTRVPIENIYYEIV